MSRAARSPAARFVPAVGLATVLGLVAGGCASGPNAMTSSEHSVVLGSTADVGVLHIRDLLVLPPAGASYPRGSDPVLRGYVANSGGTAATVTAVSSPDATGATLLAASAPTGPGPVAGAVAAPTASTAAAGPVDVPAGGLVALFAQLHSLSRGLFAGQYLPVTVQFGGGGAATLEVPVASAPEGSSVPPLGTASASTSPVPTP